MRFRPWLFTYREGEDLAEWAEKHGIPRTTVRRLGHCDLRHVGAFLRLAHQIDAALLHTHLYGANVWGELISRLCRNLVHISHIHHMNVPRRSLRSYLNKLVVARSDRVIAVSEACRQELVQRHGIPARRVVTIPNGVDLRQFRPATGAERTHARNTLGLPEDGPVIGIVASLGPNKHHENLIQAVGALHRRFPVTLAVVGTGSRERASALSKLAAEHGLREKVRFIGARADVPMILRAFDIGVLCSRNEAMPLTVLEYMATGLPVVCTQVGGIPEILGTPPSGILVPKEDPQALAAALSELLRDDRLRARTGRAARERVEEHFDIDKTVRKVEDLYAELLAEAPVARS